MELAGTSTLTIDGAAGLRRLGHDLEHRGLVTRRWQFANARGAWTSGGMRRTIAPDAENQTSCGARHGATARHRRRALERRVLCRRRPADPVAGLYRPVLSHGSCAHFWGEGLQSGAHVLRILGRCASSNLQCVDRPIHGAATSNNPIARRRWRSMPTANAPANCRTALRQGPIVSSS